MNEIQRLNKELKDKDKMVATKITSKGFIHFLLLERFSSEVITNEFFSLEDLKKYLAM